MKVTFIKIFLNDYNFMKVLTVITVLVQLTKHLVLFFQKKSQIATKVQVVLVVSNRPLLIDLLFNHSL